MIAILQTRLLHWKKQWLSLLFWILLPMMITVVFVSVANAIQEESKIPVGIVMEDDSALSENLYDSLKASPLIRVVRVSEAGAKLQVENHELDSAFVIRDGYADKIQSGNRNRLIKSYKSDLSFAYTPVSEMIISHIQEDTGRSKAAHTVRSLHDYFQGSEQPWTWEEIVATSKEIQAEENLLRTTFSFSSTGGTTDTKEITLWNIWGLWGVLSMLTTFLLFDWVIKEKNSNIIPRFAFIRFSFKSYLLQTGLWYTILLFMVDLITVAVFHYFLNEPVTWSLIAAILSYRLTLNFAAGILALISRHLSVYYSVSFILTLGLALISGAIIPIDGIMDQIPWLKLINPMIPFLDREFVQPWLIVLVIVLGIWLIRKERRIS